jgi:hypothetical protein
MVAQGRTQAEARQRNWLFDSHGLVVKDRGDLAEHKLPYAHAHAPIREFAAAIRTFKPTAIIGVAAVGGTFTREVLRRSPSIAVWHRESRRETRWTMLDCKCMSRATAAMHEQTYPGSSTMIRNAP